MSIATPTLTTSGTSSNSSTTSAAINNSLASLASNSQTFLTLLTTQLKNQDPTSPLDTNQFTAQLTQMTGVEQQLLSNQLLQQLVSQSSGSNISNAVNLIGKSVTASSTTATLQNGSASWPYTLGGNAANVSVQVTDASGNVVYTGAAPAGTGAQNFTWNGQNATGQQQTNGGVYTLAIHAADANGNPVPVNSSVQGAATAIEQVNGQTMVTVSGVQVPLSSVTAVNG
jgi:flagellar basal-body rod modification protein FlgD